MELLRWCRLQWDRVVAGGAFLVAVVLLIVGYGKISHTEFVADQVAYLMSAGFTGLLLVGLGATLWLSADLRDEWRKLHRVEEAVREHATHRDVRDLPAAVANRLADLERAVAELQTVKEDGSGRSTVDGRMPAAAADRRG